MSKSVLIRNKSLTLVENAADPTDVGTIVLWLDGQDPLANGTPPSNGAALPTWFDRSGNGYNFSAIGAGGAVPTYDASGFNSLPAVAISATNNGYAAPAALATPSGSYTIFAVINQTTGPANFDGVYLLDKDVGGRLVLNATVAPNGSDFLYFQTAFQLAGFGFSGEQAVSWRFDGVAGTASFQRAFLDVANDAAYVSTVLDGDLTLGERFTGGAVTNYIGHIAEFIIYDSALNPAQLASINGYLKTKWNL